MFQQIKANTFGTNGKTDQCIKDIEYTKKKLNDTFGNEKYNDQKTTFLIHDWAQYDYGDDT